MVWQRILIVLTVVSIHLAIGERPIETERKLELTPLVSDLKKWVDALDLEGKETYIDKIGAKIHGATRNYFTVAHNSQSRHRPIRVLTFQPDGQLFTSISPTKSDIELGEFHDDQLFLWEMKGANVQNLREAKCTRCHGDPPLFIWKQYNKWPGFFGENDDKIADNLDDYKKVRTQLSKLHRFDGLYKNVRSELFPYRFGGTRRLTLENRPNLHLTNIIFRLAARAKAKQVFTSPYADRYLYSFLIEAFDCPGHESEAIDILYKDYESRFGKKFSGLKRILLFELLGVNPIIVLPKPLKSIKDSEMVSVARHSWRVHDGEIYMPVLFGSALIERSDDPSIKKAFPKNMNKDKEYTDGSLLPLYDISYDYQFCQHLRVKALESLKRYPLELKNHESAKEKQHRAQMK